MYTCHVSECIVWVCSYPWTAEVRTDVCNSYNSVSPQQGLIIESCRRVVQSLLLTKVIAIKLAEVPLVYLGNMIHTSGVSRDKENDRHIGLAGML